MPPTRWNAKPTRDLERGRSPALQPMRDHNEGAKTILYLMLCGFILLVCLTFCWPLIVLIVIIFAVAAADASKKNY